MLVCKGEPRHNLGNQIGIVSDWIGTGLTWSGATCFSLLANCMRQTCAKRLDCGQGNGSELPLCGYRLIYSIYIYILAMVTENNFLNNTSDSLSLLACVKDDIAEPTAKAHKNYKALWGGRGVGARVSCTPKP